MNKNKQKGRHGKEYHILKIKKSANHGIEPLPTG